MRLPWLAKKDQVFVKLGEVMQAPRKGWLDQDLWTNGVIDRHFALKGFAPRSTTVNTSLWHTDGCSEDEDCEDGEDSGWDDSDEENDECDYESEASESEDGDEIGLRLYTGIESRIRYYPDDVVTIKGLFKLLSDPQLNADAERQLYIAI
ncbi:hypothetical protein FA13DRAFT_1825803 [Coprinellus micaceus]|uniref:Uncharacterized protein n=1 Tax=Coprinellus micaceus TaxID=71717 RepID=A0A4Y7TZQ7_COPMI|nr:hypothetical protein FA13DRAFT_1825803 [Coprinellus micaceus]